MSDLYKRGPAGPEKKYKMSAAADAPMAAEDGENAPMFAAPGSKERSFARSGRFICLFFFCACALSLHFAGNTAGGALTLGCALVSFLFLSLVVRFQSFQIGADKSAAADAMSAPLLGPGRKNALFLPPALRFFPPAAAFLSLAAYFAFGLDPGADTARIVADALSAISFSFAAGLGAVTLVAVGGGVTHLRQNDISVKRLDIFGGISRAGALIADKSLFFGDKIAEATSIYMNGRLYSLSDFSLDEHLPVIIAFNLCDNGELGRAYGYRGAVGDCLLRVTRAGHVQKRALLQTKTLRYYPFDPETGLAGAIYQGGDGRAVRCTVGIPEKLIPDVKYIVTDKYAQTAWDKDFAKLRVALDRGYGEGRQAVAVASGLPGQELSFLALVFFSPVLYENAAGSVGELRACGTDTMMVTDENEKAAFVKAEHAGLLRDMSQVITGKRMDRFRPESLARAVAHSRLAAAMKPRHRSALATLLRPGKNIVISASKNPDDPVHEGADIVMTSSEGGSSPAHVISGNCRISDAALLCRTARLVTFVAKKAAFMLLCAPVTASAAMLFSMLLAGAFPFSAAGAALLLLLIPLPQALVTASCEVGGQPPFPEQLSRTGVRLMGGWTFFSSLLTAALSAFLFARFINPLGAAAGGLAFIAVFLALVTNGLIFHVWGASIFKVFERSGRRTLTAAIVLCVVVLIALRLGPVNSALDFAPVPAKYLPAALLPAGVCALIYEVAAFAASVRAKKAPSGRPRWK